MCFLVVHHRRHHLAPLVLLATRDERLDRPFDPPRRWDDAAEVFAPRDREAGGTWIGSNRQGLVAALTNRGGPRPDLAARSRGLLVRDALACSGALEARDVLRAHLAATPYEGFHLLLADREQAFVLWRDAAGGGGGLPPAQEAAWHEGSHTLSSLHEPDEVPVPREALPGTDGLEAWRLRLEGLARDATPRLPGGHRILKRTPEGRRGTVCAALVVLPTDPAAPATWHFAPGPPDLAAFGLVPSPPA